MFSYCYFDPELRVVSAAEVFAKKWLVYGCDRRVSARQASVIIGRHIGHVRNQLVSGKLKGRKEFGRWLIRLDDIATYLLLPSGRTWTSTELLMLEKGCMPPGRSKRACIHRKKRMIANGE